MEYLENLGEKVGLGNVDLDNIKKQASFFLKDKFKTARLLLTDVTTSQIMTEEATNDEEWGPATTVMAAISDACYRADQYPRIVQVLHGRLSLIGKKHWRQFLKTLTVVEYLLFHGPEQVVMEFGSDRDLVEDLTRFNYVDDRMVDRGTVVRQKAKQVLKLLMEDDVLKEERERAQKLSKNILGQGSFQSSSSGVSSSRYGGFGNTTTSSRASEGLMFDTDTEEAYIDKKFTAFEERILSVKRGNRPEKVTSEGARSSGNDWRPFDEDATTPPSAQGVAESGWANFSNLSSQRSPTTNGTSTLANDIAFLEEEITMSSTPQTPTLPTISAQMPLGAFELPVDDLTFELPVDEVTPEEPKVETLSSSKSKKVSTYVPLSSSGNFKLPPPPPPPGGSKVTVKPSRLGQSSQPVPDLMDLGASAESASLEEQETASVGSKSDQAVLDLLSMTSDAQGISSDFTSLEIQSPSSEVANTRNSGPAQEIPDFFNMSSVTPSISADLFSSQAPRGRDVDLSQAFTDLSDLGSGAPSRPDLFDITKEMPSTSAHFASFGAALSTMAATKVPEAALKISDLFGMDSKDVSVSADFASIGDQGSWTKPTSTGATGLPEAVPDVFDSIAPDFASFEVRGSQSKTVAKPADDVFNLLS